MLRLLAIETRRLLREPLALSILALTILACVLAGLNGRATLEQQLNGRAAFDQSSAETADRIRKQIAEAAGPEDVAFLPVRVSSPIIAPMPLLSDLSAGRVGIEPYSATMNLRSRSDTLFRTEQLDNPELLARGSFDLGLVAIVIAPLLLIALGYGLFTQDRESGAARLVLAQSGRPFKLLAARSAPRMVIVLVPLTLTVGALLVSGPAIEGRIEAALLWLALAAVSLLFWWSIILLVNSLRIAAETAALALTGIWAVLVVIVPALIVAGTQTVIPPPSRFEQIALARSAEIAATQDYETDHPELVSDNMEGWQASMRKSATINATVEGKISPVSQAFDERLAEQQDMVRRFQLLSPPMLASDALASIAGTDEIRFRAFRAAANTHLGVAKTFLAGRLERDSVMSQSDIDAMPEFAWSPPPSSFVWVLVLLGGFTILIGAIAAQRFGALKLE